MFFAEPETSVKRLPVLLLMAPLAACTSADPWRHFPQQARPLSYPAPAPEAAAPAPAAATQPAPPAAGAARRAVPAEIVRMPPPPAPPPAVPAPVLPPPPGASGPQPVIGCDAGGCHTPEGRTQGGTGNVQLDRGGRPCHLAGGWLQCF